MAGLTKCHQIRALEPEFRMRRHLLDVVNFLRRRQVRQAVHAEWVLPEVRFP